MEGEDDFIPLVHDPYQSFGNPLDIPMQFSWLAYSIFSKTHGTTASFAYRGSFLTKMAGNILAFHIFGQVIVVLNTAKATRGLLESARQFIRIVL
jgi:hypothetical protein